MPNYAALMLVIPAATAQACLSHPGLQGKAMLRELGRVRRSLRPFVACHTNLASFDLYLMKRGISTQLEQLVNAVAPELHKAVAAAVPDPLPQDISDANIDQVGRSSMAAMR